MDQNFRKLVEMLLPAGVLEYFDLIDSSQDKEGIDIYLEEKNKIPVEHQHKKAHSKGFFSEVAIQDFPIRGQKVTLHAKRRRWEVLEDGEIITRDWEIVKKGTRMTPEFGAFLKGLLR